MAIGCWGTLNIFSPSFIDLVMLSTGLCSPQTNLQNLVVDEFKFCCGLVAQGQVLVSVKMMPHEALGLSRQTLAFPWNVLNVFAHTQKFTREPWSVRVLGAHIFLGHT